MFSHQSLDNVSASFPWLQDKEKPSDASVNALRRSTANEPQMGATCHAQPRQSYSTTKISVELAGADPMVARDNAKAISGFPFAAA